MIKSKKKICPGHLITIVVLKFGWNQLKNVGGNFLYIFNMRAQKPKGPQFREKWWNQENPTKCAGALDYDSCVKVWFKSIEKCSRSCLQKKCLHLSPWSHARLTTFARLITMVSWFKKINKKGNNFYLTSFWRVK